VALPAAAVGSTAATTATGASYIPSSTSIDYYDAINQLAGTGYSELTITSGGSSTTVNTITGIEYKDKKVDKFIYTPDGVVAGANNKSVTYSVNANTGVGSYKVS
jgi:hypothetical protein